MDASKVAIQLLEDHALFYGQLLQENNAQNFVSALYTHPTQGELVIVLQKANGQTPEELRRALAQDNEVLAAANKKLLKEVLELQAQLQAKIDLAIDSVLPSLKPKSDIHLSNKAVCFCGAPSCDVCHG